MKWIVVLVFGLEYCFGEEVQVNTNRWSQVVSERFLSITVDPLALILSSPLGHAAVNLARGLNPMFVRIGGPNTEHIHFGSGEHNNLSVTTEQWMSVNSFAEDAGVDLIVSLSAMNRVEKVWDSGTALQIISASHTGGYPISWQFGYDISNMMRIGGDEVGRDLVRLRKILDAFPNYRSAPVLPPGLTSDYPEFIGGMIHEANNVITALPLHLNFSGVGVNEIDEEITTALKLLDQQTKGPSLVLRTVSPPPRAVWIVDTSTCKGDFKDAMLWMIKLGNAARLGVQVVMKQPNLNSFHSPTPDYWASLLFKHLVGRFVLDTRIVPASRNGLQIFSHCTLETNHNTSILDYMWNYEKGAVTAFGVNPAQRSIQVNFKGLSVKEEMVHIYTLTSALPGLSSWETLFNGQKLGLSPRGELPVLSPRVRKVSRVLSLPVPPNSIFFVVFPDLKLRTCTTPTTVPPVVVDNLAKKKLVPIRVQPATEESFPKAFDQPNDVYVSFMKKKRKQVKEPPQGGIAPPLDLSHKLLREFNRMAERLGFRKPKTDHSQPRSQEENVKYNFYNDNSWLNKITEGVDDSGSVEIQQKQIDDDYDKNQKYSLLTSAIFGKDANKSGFVKSMGYTPEQYFRSKREVEGSSISNAEAKVNKDFPFKESIQKVHNFILDYIAKVGSKLDPGMLAAPVGIDSLNDFLKNLGQIEVKVGESFVPTSSGIEEVPSVPPQVNSEYELSGGPTEESSERNKRDLKGVWCNKAVQGFDQMNPVDLTSAELNCTDYKERNKRDVTLQNEDQEKDVNKYIEKLSALGEELIRKAEELPKKILSKVQSGCLSSSTGEGDVKKLCDTINGNNEEKNFEYFSKMNNVLNTITKIHDGADNKMNHHNDNINKYSHNGNQERLFNIKDKSDPRHSLDGVDLIDRNLKITDSSLEPEETMKYHNIHDFVKRANTALQNRKTTLDSEEHQSAKASMVLESVLPEGLPTSFEDLEPLQGDILTNTKNVYQHSKILNEGNSEIMNSEHTLIDDQGKIMDGEIIGEKQNDYDDGIGGGDHKETDPKESQTTGVDTPVKTSLLKSPGFDEKFEKKRQQLEELKHKIQEVKEKFKEALAKASLISHHHPLKHSSIHDFMEGLKSQNSGKKLTDSDPHGIVEKINSMLQPNQQNGRSKREVSSQTQADHFHDDYYDHHYVKPTNGIKYLVPFDTRNRRVILNNIAYPAKVYSIVDKDEIQGIVNKKLSQDYMYDEDTMGDGHPLSGYRSDLDYPIMFMPEERIRMKRSVYNNDESYNSLSKVGLNGPSLDEIKVKVDEKFKGENPSLFTLAKEYSYLKGQIDNPGLEKLTEEGFPEQKDQTLEGNFLGENDENVVGNLHNQESIDDDDSWINTAERVSPPRKERNRNKQSRRRESRSDGTIISSFVEKLTNLMGFIRSFVDFRN